MKKIKMLLKKIMPPFMAETLSNHRQKFGFFGGFSTWSEAEKQSKGYGDKAILEKVKASMIAVRDGKAAFERDSMLFYTPEYSWPIVAVLLSIALRNQNKLSVLDFGGSLGTSYFQNKAFFSNTELEWSIVEQKNFVESGKQDFQTETLKFYEDIDTCLSQCKRKPDVILLSSTLQYLPIAKNFFQILSKYYIKHIIVDRTPFVMEGEDQITLQRVRPEIYDANYPALILNYNIFLDSLPKDYRKVADFPFVEYGKILPNGPKIQLRGFYLEKK